MEVSSAVINFNVGNYDILKVFKNSKMGDWLFYQNVLHEKKVFCKWWKKQQQQMGKLKHSKKIWRNQKSCIDKNKEKNNIFCIKPVHFKQFIYYLYILYYLFADSYVYK